MNKLNIISHIYQNKDDQRLQYKYKKEKKDEFYYTRLISTNWFLLCRIIHSNDLALIGVTLREGISSRLLKTLNLSHFVHRLSETIHSWAIIRKIELLYLLNIMIAASTIQSLVAKEEFSIFYAATSTFLTYYFHR